MAEEVGAAARVQQLEQQLATLQAKLQKSDTVKKKLREHLALLKEKAINSLALVEEQVLLQQEHAKLQQQYTEASAAVSQLQQAAEDAEAAKQAAEGQYHAVLQDLKATEGKLRSAERNFNSALKASMKAQQAVKERDEALAGMKNMQQQIQQLQLAVRQLQRGQPGQQQSHPAVQGDQSPPLQQQQHKPRTELTAAQQQQLVQKVKQLEAWVVGLQDIDIEIDVSDMYSQLQRSVIDALNAKIDNRLDGLQQRLAQLQQQQKAAEATPAVAASTAAAGALRSPLDRPATQRDVQQLQQQMETLAAQQQHWHALLQRMLADSAATAAGGMQGLHQDESCFLPPAVASAGPTREASPAVAAAFGHSSGAVAASSEAVVTAVGRGVHALRNAAAAGAPASMTTGARGSSMFGTTALVVGGTNSSYGDGRTDTGDRVLQAGSPSVGTATPRYFVQKQTLQQEQLIGEKRQREEEQDAEEEEQRQQQHEGEELDPWDVFLESNDVQLQLPDSGPLKQGAAEHVTGEVPSKRARSGAVTAAAAAAQPTLQVCQSPKQGPCTDQQPQQHELMKQLQAVRAQQAAAADVAKQLAEALAAGNFSEQLLLDNFAACFLMDVAPVYDMHELHRVLASLQEEQLLQMQLSRHASISNGSSCSNQLQQQLLGQLCTAGWAESSDGGAAASRLLMSKAQWNLAECACKLSAAIKRLHAEQQQNQPQLQQQQLPQQQEPQQQQTCAAAGWGIQQCSSLHAPESYQWPALAECWQAEHAVPGCSRCSGVQQYCSGTSQLNSNGEQLRLVYKVACHVMAPVYKSVSQLGAAVLEEQRQQHAKQALQQQHGVDEQQQQPAVHVPNVAQACAAAAAAAHLYKAAGDRHRYLQLLARLLSMTAAYNWSSTTNSSSSSCQDSSTARVISACELTAVQPGEASQGAAAVLGEGDREGCSLAADAAGAPAGAGDRGACHLRADAATAAARQCSRLGVVCLLAAVGAWPAALQFDTAAADSVLMDAEVLTAPNQQCCARCSSKTSAADAEGKAGSNSCLFWQWLVLHPALVAVRCCLQHLCGTVAAALPEAAASAPPKQFDDGAAVRKIAEALQVVLELAAAAEGVTGSVTVNSAKECSSVVGSAGDGCTAVCVPAPDQLLGCLLGVLLVLLQKQRAGLPPDWQLPPFQRACEAAVATFCAAGSVVALFVPQQTVQASLQQLRGSLGGDVLEWPLHVQRFLGCEAV